MGNWNRRKQLRRNLLEMYRDNAMRSQSYMDVVRLEKFLALMWTKFVDELQRDDLKHLGGVGEQLELFAVGSSN